MGIGIYELLILLVIIGVPLALGAVVVAVVVFLLMRSKKRRGS